MPLSAVVTLHLAALAPAIGLPARGHWNSTLVGAGRHVPVVTVSVLPTVAVPVMRGATVRVNAGSGAVTLNFPTRNADVLGSGREIYLLGGKVGEYQMEVSDGPTFFLAPGQRAIVVLHPRGKGQPPEVWNTLPVVNGQVIFYDGDCATRAGLVLTPYDGAGKELRHGGETIDVALQGGSMPIASFEKLLTDGA